MSLKVIIAGTRSIVTLGHVIMAVELAGLHGKITEVVSGGATGGDQSGEKYAKRFGIRVRQFIPDWNNVDVLPIVIAYRKDMSRYNARAGIARNEKMGDYADELIAVWDGKSTGTSHMIRYMGNLNKPVHVFYLRELDNGYISERFL